MDIGNIGLYLRTVRLLKPKQVLYRLWYGLRKRLPDYSYRSDKARPENISWAPLTPAVPFPDYPAIDTDAVARGEFSFLNIQERYDQQPEWSDAGKSRLWRYNLHYFNYLLGKARLSEQAALSLIRHWIRENPPGTADAWDPFPTSLRIVNWIKYIGGGITDQSEPTAVLMDISESIYEQTCWLASWLEHHILANHIFKNAKALLFAGFFFSGPQALRWRTQGLNLLRRELAEQILPDGGHFERSPMYHAMILEDCLDMINVCHPQLQASHSPAFVQKTSKTGNTLWRIPETKLSSSRLKDFCDRLLHTSEKMMHYLVGMTHPDGQMALFNDAAFGIERSPENLQIFFENLTGKRVVIPQGPIWSFPESGYFILAPQTGDRLIMDCGPVGPDYQPGHAHCDLLSFELSLQGRRVIVDSGCFQYEDASIRQYNRGNAGHNSVTIDGRNQSEVWGAHRVARRAYPIEARLEARAHGSLCFSGAHNGYRHLSGSPIHRRTVTWSGDELLIEDRVEGCGRHDIQSRLHIHPNLLVVINNGKATIHDGPVLLAIIAPAGSGRIELEAGWYCPEFGMRQSCNVLFINHHNTLLPFYGGWKLTTGV